MGIFFDDSFTLLYWRRCVNFHYIFRRRRHIIFILSVHFAASFNVLVSYFCVRTKFLSFRKNVRTASCTGLIAVTFNYNLRFIMQKPLDDKTMELQYAKYCYVERSTVGSWKQWLVKTQETEIWETSLESSRFGRNVCILRAVSGQSPVSGEIGGVTRRPWCADWVGVKLHS
jgi:hypothetical protein